ncbi:hypothetical protein PV328_007549 [Microctonus aethiopoides]|uniref:Uncharacterized protein n=1 Tax=Microctonus aethiopoides TaxID=144406 RepID=A0AA39F1H6_9HYME|nr:hypothetical protein PV328_007549 [Microctonus aethiopoides]
MFSCILYPLLILVLISPCFDNANAGAIKRSLRSYIDNSDCPKLGDYNVEQIKAIASLDRVCSDCYDLFREPSIYIDCRRKCFTTKYFSGCAETLLIDDDELEKFKQDVILLHSYFGVHYS